MDQGSEAACVEEAAGDVTGEAAEFSGCSSEVFQVTLSVSTIPVMQRWSTTIIVTANVIASRESFALPGGYRGVRSEGEWHGGNAAHCLNHDGFPSMGDMRQSAQHRVMAGPRLGAVRYVPGSVSGRQRSTV